MNIILNVLNIVLGFLFKFTGDWGITIILVTVLVKVLLLPMSIKQKVSMDNQQVLAKKIEEIKVKYKGDEEKIKQETQDFYVQSTKGMLGCLVTFLQLPIIYSLYHVIIKIPYKAGTILIPWISNIKVPDKYYIIPMIYIGVSCIPMMLPYIPFLKNAYRTKINASKTSIITTVVFSLIIIIKAPIAIGMYFITTSLFSAIEEVGFRLYMRNKCLN